MIAVVTGANGFVGRQLCSRLAERGHEVRRIVRGDFADGRFEAIVDGADTVIHAAGATRAPTRERLRVSNVDLTQRALSAAAATGVKRFVFISSQAAAGPAPSRDRPVGEGDIASPVEAYGESKRDAEALVQASPVSSVIVRPSAVYGPHDRDFRALFALARRGLAIHPGNRDQWISIIHVNDCVDGIILAATSDAAIGRTYFLANDEPVQWRTLFEMAREAAGASRIADVEVPLPLVRIGALAGDLAARLTGHTSLLTTEKVALSAAPFWICSNARAKRDLAFLPRIAVRDGVVQTYRWYLENGGL